MAVMLTIGVLALLLAACAWEARTGRPQWGSPHGRIDPGVRDAAKRNAGGSAVTAYWMVEGGGDGG